MHQREESSLNGLLRPESAVDAIRRAAQNDALTSIHRLTFSVTTFPFQDPSPHLKAHERDLLGLRIDIGVRGGRFAKPYYVLLLRIPDVHSAAPTDNENENDYATPREWYRIRQHTIPPFIPLPRLARRYLPGSAGAGEIDDPASLKPGHWPRQDLKRFAYELRRELYSWHARRGAVELLCEKLGLGEDGKSRRTRDSSTQEDQNSSSFGITAVTSTSADARFIRLEWIDGQIGRIRISNVGYIDKAIVLGRQGRDHQTETVILGGDRKIESLAERLKQHWERAQGSGVGG